MTVWLREDVAKAQRDLVSDELRGIWPETYMVFGEALNAVPRAESILDVGCGVGGYAHICKKLRPKWHYTGTDISPYMIAEARKMAPQGVFEVKDFFANDFDAAGVVLVSSTLEYTDDPLAALSFLLYHARGYVVLHRLHLTIKETHPVLEPTYCGLSEHKLHWNREDIITRIRANRTIKESILWAGGQMLTVIVDKRED